MSGVFFESILKGLPVTIRDATYADYDAVMQIEETVYFGADYMPTMYNEYMGDPKTHMFVALVEGEVAAFVAYSIVGAAGDRTYGMAGRMKPKYRNLGIFVIFQRLARREMKRRYPRLAISWGCALAVDQMIKNTLEINGKVLHTWFLSFAITTHKHMCELIEKNTPTMMTPLTIPAVVDLVKDPLSRAHLFPQGFMLIADDVTPAPALPEEARLLAMKTPFFSSGSGVNQAVSTVQSIRSPMGMAFTITYCGSSDIEVLKHHILSAIARFLGTCGMERAMTKPKYSVNNKDLGWPTIGFFLTCTTPIDAEEVKILYSDTLHMKREDLHPKLGLFVTPYQFFVDMPDPE